MAYSVVIAEDFRMIREIFESAVQGARGYTLASSFMTAEDAVSYLSENEADLVLMDVLFPGSMNGLDAAAVIKEARPLTKIIIVTSMPELTYISRAKDIGVEGGSGTADTRDHGPRDERRDRLSRQDKHCSHRQNHKQ